MLILKFSITFYMKSKFVLPSLYLKNSLPQAGAGYFSRKKGRVKPAFQSTLHGTCGVWINGKNTAASDDMQLLKSSYTSLINPV